GPKSWAGSVQARPATSAVKQPAIAPGTPHLRVALRWPLAPPPARRVRDNAEVRLPRPRFNLSGRIGRTSDNAQLEQVRRCDGAQNPVRTALYALSLRRYPKAGGQPYRQPSAHQSECVAPVTSNGDVGTDTG